jgi:hypothetical protein
MSSSALSRLLAAQLLTSTGHTTSLSKQVSTKLALLYTNAVHFSLNWPSHSSCRHYITLHPNSFKWCNKSKSSAGQNTPVNFQHSLEPSLISMMYIWASLGSTTTLHLLLIHSLMKQTFLVFTCSYEDNCPVSNGLIHSHTPKWTTRTMELHKLCNRLTFPNIPSKSVPIRNPHAKHTCITVLFMLLILIYVWLKFTVLYVIRLNFGPHIKIKIKISVMEVVTL